MAEETKTLNAEDQLASLGYDPNMIDGELDPNDPAANVPSQKEAGLDPPETAPQQEDAGLDPQPDPEPEVTEGQEPEQQTEPETQTKPDANDKTWQSQYDKEHAEKARLEAELKRAEAEKQALLAIYQSSGMTQGQAPQGVANPQAAAQSQTKRPELWDFINKDDYNSYEASDPSTVSGQAYQQWQDATHDWRAEQTMRKYETQRVESEKQKVAQTQAAKLAEKYPQFRNPLTGQPNYQAITAFMEELSNSDDPELWADLFDFKQSRTKNGKQAPQTQQTLSPEQIGRNANKVGKVIDESAAEKTTKPVPKTVKIYNDIFGGGMEMPVGAELE